MLGSLIPMRNRRNCWLTFDVLRMRGRSAIHLKVASPLGHDLQLRGFGSGKAGLSLFLLKLLSPDCFSGVSSIIADSNRSRLLGPDNPSWALNE